MISSIREFLKLESASGILLIAAATLAMVLANSPLFYLYDALLATPVEVSVGDLEIAKPLLLWINDGLMAVFFFLVGLEVKREVLEGELSEPARVVLPAIGAVGGMAVPALIYSYFNWEDPVAMKGWAIPSATDIAFALGVLAILGNRVPLGLKLFLLTLAIVDDLGAIIIIALFYTTQLSTVSMAIASAALVVLFLLNVRGVTKLTPYLLVGVVLWTAVLKSGVHATLAGVVLALFIPLKLKNDDGKVPLKQLEHDLHPTVAFGILPIFAFANAGLPLSGVSLSSLAAPLPLGIALGLFLGNQIGVFGLCWLAIKLRIAVLPTGVTWLQFYGVSILCGIGFTMSLFIGSLAFEHVTPEPAYADKLGVLIGSVLSAVIGYLVLRYALAKSGSEPP